MKVRFVGSFCSLVLAWLCALGATPARHAAAPPDTVRGAVEIMLRNVADAPQPASRPKRDPAAIAAGALRHSRR